MAQGESRTCAHEGCICQVAASSPQRDKQYCSDGCACGRGCAHPDCNCAAFEAPMRGD